MRILLFFFYLRLIAMSLLIQGQGVKEEQISYGSVLNKPIDVEVIRLNNKVEFVCTNKSFHPYEVELEFRDLQNLRPFIKNVKWDVSQGRTRLIEFTIIDTEKSHYYSYNIKYSRGTPRLKANEDYPYLVPLKLNDTIVIDGLWRNHFLIDRGDTVFATRKGIVAALPDNKYETDRVMKNSLEVIHKDGTIAVYNYLDQEKTFVKLGQTVIPGQAIGQVGTQTFLMLTIFKSVGEGKLQAIKPKFIAEGLETKPFTELEGLIVSRPASVVTKELTKRELNRYIRQTIK